MYAALQAPIGIVVKSEDREYSKNQFYRIRAERRPAFNGLALVMSPSTHNEMWIIKKIPDAQAQTGLD